MTLNELKEILENDVKKCKLEEKIYIAIAQLLKAHCHETPYCEFCIFVGDTGCKIFDEPSHWEV